MKLISLTALAVLLTGCAGGMDTTDTKMYGMHRDAVELEAQGATDEALTAFNECIAQKPAPEDIHTSQPRNMCQNSLIVLMAECGDSELCDSQKAIELALELATENTGLGEPQITYLGAVADSFASAGKFDHAIETLNIAIAKLDTSNPYYQPYQDRLTRYKQGKL